MSVAMLLITHGQLGAQMLSRTEANLGPTTRPISLVSVEPGDDPDGIYQLAIERLEQLDTSDGVLIVSDLFGATPGNIGLRLAEHPGVRCIHGLNLAMLLRAQNYPKLPLEELVERMLEGGKLGVMEGPDS